MGCSSGVFDNHSIWTYSQWHAHIQNRKEAVWSVCVCVCVCVGGGGGVQTIAVDTNSYWEKYLLTNMLALVILSTTVHTQTLHSYTHSLSASYKH